MKSPIARLDFWRVTHHLRHRLEPYRATRPAVNTWRGESWKTLVHWRMLLDEDDEALIRYIGRPQVDIPDPDVWFGRVGA